MSSSRAINNATKIPLSLDLLLPRITRLRYSTFHNFRKFEPFLNAGLGMVLKYDNVVKVNSVEMVGDDDDDDDDGRVLLMMTTTTTTKMMMMMSG